MAELLLLQVSFTVIGPIFARGRYSLVATCATSKATQLFSMTYSIVSDLLWTLHGYVLDFTYILELRVSTYFWPGSVCIVQAFQG